ncbi:MAG: PhoX family phosphatase [Chthonomonadales bacterium]|nr:PhoX family phosphatase [Chthonomonadales bacterium]
MKARHWEDDPAVRSDQGIGDTFGDVIARRLSRRDLLRAGLVAGFGVALTGIGDSPAHADGQVRPSPTGLDFAPLTPSKGPDVLVPAGYRSQIVVRWGDPLGPGASDAFDPAALTPRDQAVRFGYNCDFVGFMPLPRGSRTSDHGLLVVNHEYVNPELMFPVESPGDLTREQVDACMEAMGLSVVEVRRAAGRWSVVVDGARNRRVTATTSVIITGPARGDERMKTSDHPDGTSCTGTMHNCSAGTTPWGTVLSAEENFQDMFGNASALMDARDRRSAQRYGLGENESVYRFERHLDRLDCGKEPHEPYHFGWVVEVDPYDRDWTPRKRTALGRFRHEAATTHVTRGGKVVLYSGDDARFEYVYKFVCARPYDPRNRAVNRDLLDDGILYVARFNEDGSGDWLPLVHGRGPLTEDNGFRSQADVAIDARIAAHLVGATKMDRPEDIEVNPANRKVYVVCTNNVDRGADGKAKPDRPNPRVRNAHGHIIEIAEAGDDHAATSFRWELFMVCGEPDDPATYFAGFDRSQVSPISCPDNICFDRRGNLWIATDGQEKALDRRDGFYAVPVAGPERGRLRQFMESVEGSEVCGPEFTPDGKTVFLAIQHPGEGSTFSNPTTRWPDGSGPPRPSVIAIQAENGGVIGGRGT